MKKSITAGIRLKSIILSGGSMLALSLASPAFAECTPDPTPAFGTVTCTGTDADGLVVDTNQTTVNVEDNASVSSVVTTTRITAANPFDNFNFITLNVDGAITNGVTVDSGTTESGVSFFPSTTTSLVVGADGSVRGATAIGFTNDLSLPFGTASIDIDNSGVIESTTGPAILATNAERQNVGRLVNQTTGRIAGVHAIIGSFDNQGVIDGGNDSAIRYDTAGSSAFFSSGGTNDGVIRSNSTRATFDVQSPDISSLSLTNDGMIENTGLGDTFNFQSTFASLTNSADGVVLASRGTAISGNSRVTVQNDGEISGTAGAISVAGQLFLTNRGVINGDIAVSAGTFVAGSVLDLSGGGTVNGSVTLGSGDDFVTTEFLAVDNLLGGINGALDAGTGNNTLQVNFSADTTLTEAVIAPTGFQTIKFGIVGGSTLTLDSGFSTTTTINLEGEPFPPENVNNFVNKADISTNGMALAVGAGTSALTITNEGTISATLVNSFDFAVQLRQVNEFTNSGSISANVGRGVDISGNIPVTNTGDITADDNALELFGSNLTNSGSIRSKNAIGLVLTGSSGTNGRNTGVIEGRTAGLRLSTGPFINSGTILGSVGPGVELSFNGNLENAAGGTISGGSAAIGPDALFGYTRGATVRNAGTIDGDVDFGFISFGMTPFFSNNRFIVEDGGVVNGDLHLGSGGDTLITRLVNDGPGEFAGITGSVTGGPDSMLTYIVDEDTEAGISLSGIFTRLSYDLSNDALLTLSGPATLNKIDFVGSGRVDLNSDLSSFSDGSILRIGVGDSIQMTGDPAIPVPNMIDFTSRGTLTIIDDNLFGSAPTGVLVFSETQFTNEGTIIVHDIVPNPDGPRMAGVGGTSGTIINNGTISVGAASAIEGGLFFGENSLTVTNNGTISQLEGAADGVGVANVGSLTNSGTIRVGGVAVEIGFQGGAIVNSGVIESTNDNAIRNSEGFSNFVTSTVSNLQGGTITGAVGQLAIGLKDGATVENAGIINGDVNLSFESNFPFRGSAYVSNGGVLNGDLTFGSANDTYISIGDGVGVTGTIDAGLGTDQFVQGFTESTTTQATALLPESFEVFGIAAIGPNVTVIVEGPEGGIDTAISYLGNGTIINRADVASSGPLNPFATAPNPVSLGAVGSASLNQGGLAFINEAELTEGVAGTARSFSNKNVIGSDALVFQAVNLLTSGGSTFEFENSGTITTAADNPAVIRATAVTINAQFDKPSLSSASFQNSGDIVGIVSGSLLASNFTFNNSGSITASKNGLRPPSFFNAPAVALSIQEAQIFPNPGSPIGQTADLKNSGFIEGLNASLSVREITFDNSGEISSDVQILQHGLRNGLFEETSAKVINSGNISGVDDGTSVVFGLSAESELIEFDNSGTIFAPVQPDQITVRNSVVAIENRTNSNHDIHFENSATVLSESRAGTGVLVTALANSGFAPGLQEPLAPANSSVNVENSGSVRANGGAAFNEFTFFNGIEITSIKELINAAGVAAFASADGESEVTITNTATGTIESVGNLRLGNSPADPLRDHPEVLDVPAGLGSTAVLAYGDTITINNSGTIVGGAGGDISDFGDISIDVGEQIDAAVLFPNRFMAGAIQTFESIDLVRNEVGGTITGSIDLGAFDDVLENRGTINGNIFLRDGDDVFVQGATGIVNGIVDGGLGADTLDIDSTGSTGEGFDLEQFINFETVAISGTGTIGLSGDLQFETVMLNGGSLEIAEGESLSTTGAVAITGGTGNEMVTNRGTISGAVVLGDGDDTLTNFGTIIGPVDLGAGDDTFTHTNDSITASVSGGAGNDILALAFSGTEEAPDSLDLVNFSEFETLQQNIGFIRVSDQLSFANINLIGGRLIGEAGSIITSDVITVASGATFGSAGTVNADIVVNGTLSPGASPGIMTVTGDVDFGSGSTTVFEITPTVSDQLIVTGAISVADGAVLNLTGNRPLTPGAPLNLITSTDGIAGLFTVNKAEEIFGFIRQQANAIQLIGLFSVDSGFGSQVATTVEYTNGVLQSGSASSALIDALPQLTTSAGATDAAAFAQLSPEAYASAGQIGIENGLAISKSLRGDQFNPSTEEAGLFTFANGFGNWRRLAGRASIGTSRANIRNSGVVGGIGFGSEKGSISALIGFVDARQSIGDLGTTTEADGIVLGAVGNIVVDRFRGSASLIFDGSSADTDRTLPGNTSVTSDYKMRGWTVDISATYAMPVAENWLAEPQLGITHVSSRRAGVNENSGSPFNLDIVGQRYRGTFIDAAFALRGGQKNGAAIRPWISAGVRYQLNNGATSATAGFSGAVTNFSISGAERRDTHLTLGAGIEADIGRSTTIFAGYNGELGSGSGGNQAQVGIRIGF